MYHEQHNYTHVEMPQLQSLPPFQRLGSAGRRCEYRIVGITASVVVGAVSSAVLRYSDSCTDGGEYSRVLGQGGFGSVECFLAADLNTFATLVAIFLYCVSTGILYYLQHQKRYVDVSLVCGVALGLVIGFAAGLSPRETLFHLLPGSALAALVVSELGSDVEAVARDTGKVVSL